MFSCLKDFVEENNVERSDTGIHQCIRGQLVNLQYRFSKYFPEAVSDKYKSLTDPFHADSPQNYDILLEEEKNYIEIIPGTSFKVQFHKKSYIEFWVGIGGEFLHLSRKTLNILLLFAAFYLCETALSAVVAIRTIFFLIGKVRGGVQLGPLGTAATNRPGVIKLETLVE
jgi:hypothetical protein